MFGFINGIIFTLAVLAAAAVAGIYLGVMPAGADVKPPAAEKWAAKQSLHASIRRETSGVTNPLQASDADLLAAVQSYGANCAVCHGAADGKPSLLAQGFYIKAPQLASDGVEDDPEAVTHWKLVHGIRFSAMPAFANRLTDQDLWRLSAFLKQMDKLPPAVDAAWKKLPSAAPPPAR